MSALLGILAIHENKGDFVVIFFLLCLVFDFVDGFVARLLKASSSLGKELDSLADVVSFGVFPSFYLYHYLESENAEFWSYFALLVPLFAAYRLAKFNLDTEQTQSFKGLPTPAAAIFFIGLPHTFDYFSLEILWPIYMIILLVCWLMVSNVGLIALKFKGTSFTDNWSRYLLIIGSLLLLLVFQKYASSVVIGFYLILSILAKGK